VFALDCGIFRAEDGVRGLADVEASGPPGGGLMEISVRRRAKDDLEDIAR